MNCELMLTYDDTLAYMFNLFYFCPSKIFFVTFFSATIDGRNLIFGHKLHIGMPYPSDSYFLFADLVGFYTH
jgi:hypothetical protein